MKPIKYNADVLKIIKNLSAISKTRDGNTPIKFIRDEEGIHVRSGTEAKTIVFCVDFSNECFDIPDESLSFYDYPEFYKYLDSFDSPDLSIGIVNEGTDREFEAVVIKKNKRKISYQTSDEETIKNALKKKPKSVDYDAKFNLSSEDYVQIKKLINLFDGDDILVNLKFKENVVDVKIKSENVETLYEDQFELESKVEEEFELDIRYDVFKYLLNADYVVGVSKDYESVFFNFELESIKGYIIVTGE